MTPNEAEGGLGSVEEAFAGESAGSYGDHRLVDVISYSCRVLLHSEKYFDSFSLVVLKDVVEKEVGREYQKEASQSRYYRQMGKEIPLSECLKGYERQSQSAASEKYP